MRSVLKIERIKALEVLDSRGNPTVQVEAFSGKFFRKSISAIRGIYRKF